MSICEVAAIEKKVEQGAIGLTFNSKLSVKIYGPSLNSSLVVSPIGYMHVAMASRLSGVGSCIGRWRTILKGGFEIH